MKIKIQTTPEEFNQVKAVVEASIVNFDEWEKGKEKLKYKLGNLITDDLTIEI